MLIDDHPVVRAGISSYIEVCPSIQVVAESDNGLDAIPLVNTIQPDVIVVDLEMPKMGGVDFILWLQQAHPNIRAIALASNAEECQIAQVLKAGAKGFLLKSSPPETLIRGIEDVFSNRSALDPQIADKLVSILTAAPAAEPTVVLTKREMEILKEVARGESNKNIGEHLHVSGRTVQGHLHNIYEKLHVKTRTEAVAKAVSMKMLELDDIGGSRVKSSMPVNTLSAAM